jgi:asparagine synthase (glutamine-hydrolysing)
MVRYGQLARGVLRDLGPRWALFRLGYELKQRSGWQSLRTPPRQWSDCPLEAWLQPGIPPEPTAYEAWRRRVGRNFFFTKLPPILDQSSGQAIRIAEELLGGHWRYFERQSIRTGFPPDWHRNPITGQRTSETLHWSRISETVSGDIKLVWEPSRFAAAYVLARAYAASGDERYPAAFWTLAEDWAARNPPMTGANWRCGQEAAFRIMAWCFGLWAFKRSGHTNSTRVAHMATMLAWHASRVERNLAYARSQHNNHAISEGLGLWTVGLLFPEFAAATRWLDLGRRVLLEEAERQIHPDGGYVQNSLNYHRLMLHDYLWVLRLGELNGSRFPDRLYHLFERAAGLLFALTDPLNGQAPNYGANDGACALPLSDCDFTDYRPTLQAAHYLCHHTRLYPAGPWDEMLVWLFGPEAASAPVRSPAPRVTAADESGYYTLRGPESWGFIRCARYRSRPSHADQLHVDLWWRGMNVVCDAGTYLYSGPGPWRNNLARTRVHNTVVVDDRNQMTRAGRFLWLDWAQGRTRTHTIHSEWDYFEGEHDGYRALGVTHRRGVLRARTLWVVVDDLLGGGSPATRLHWLLPDFPYRVLEAAQHLTVETPAGGYAVQVWCSAAADLSLVRAGSSVDELRGWRSLYYAERVPALSFVLESQAGLPIRFITVLGPSDFATKRVEATAVTVESESGVVSVVLDSPGQDLILNLADSTIPGISN